MGAMLRRWGLERWKTEDSFVESANGFPELDGNPQIYLYSYLFAEDRPLQTKGSPPDIDPKEGSIRRCFRLGIALRGESYINRPYLDNAGNLQLLSTISKLHNPRLTFHGRIVDPVRVHVQLAREWLDECRHSHGEICETAAEEGSVAYISKAPRNLRVIDVNSMSLVLLPNEAKYIVLSYRWAQPTYTADNRGW
jgi:hypothetical protein